jgi:hypothetical protein
MEIKVKDFARLFTIVSSLSSNADVPSFSLRRQMSKVMPDYKKELELIGQEEEAIIRKYYNKVDKVPNGINYTEIKEGMTAEQFNAELNAFVETTINITPLEIKENDLETVTVFTQSKERIAMPAEFLTVLDCFIIDIPAEKLKLVK